MIQIKYFIGLIFILISMNINAGIIIPCEARYQYQVYHAAVEPSYHEGKVTGRHPIAGTGRDAYYEAVWSDTYSLAVSFYSGYELNEFLNQSKYDDNSIIAIVNWTDGGHSIIIIEYWGTELKTMTEEEIKYSSDGERISSMTGYDDEGRIWEFYF